MAYDRAWYQAGADYVRARWDRVPEFGLILGSGCGPLAAQIRDRVEIPYGEIPNFLRSTVSTHAGKLICGTLAGRTVACMSGRFHYYEGYDFEQLAAPVRLFKCLGCRTVVLTNAAGGVNLAYKPGDVMILRDHIKLMGGSPMRGPNAEEFGPRFFDVQQMYTPALRQLAKDCAAGSGLTVHEGTYFYMPGPQFETPAEIRAIRLLGGDAVGMSTVTEALTAAHCGLPCLAFSVITNMAAGILDAPLTDEEVNEVGHMIADRFSAYLGKVVARL